MNYRQRYLAISDPFRSVWRQQANRVIKDTLSDAADTEPAVALKLVDAAYPFGPRKYYPYKAWLVERHLVKVALGIEQPTPKQAKAIRAAEGLGMFL